MRDVLANYLPGAAFDEMMDAQGTVRPSYQTVYSTLAQAAPGELRVISESLANNYAQAGVTFDIGGVERRFPLDLVPRVIASAEWDSIESGVAQRVRALEAFLDDVYTDARVIADGVIPRQLVTSSSTTTGPSGASGRPTASASTWPASTSSARRRATCGCWRTTSGCPAASRT